MKDLPANPWPQRDPGQPNALLARATDPAVRKQWSQALAGMRERSAAADPFLFCRELLDEATRFRAETDPTCCEILGATLVWSDDEHAFVKWARDAWHSIARTAADALRRAVVQDALLTGAGGELAALSLTAYGDAIKWAEIASAGRDPVSTVEVRRVHDLVERAGLGHERFAVPRAGPGAPPTLDSLFVRATLLDAICRGNLDPRQVEIVDTWLWEWAGDYPLTDSEAGAVLPLEPRQRGSPPPTGEARARRYVRVDALDGHIRRVAEAFRRGEIYPGHGCMTGFRVEEHAAALDFLRRFLESIRYRRSRQSREGRERSLESMVGLGQILDKAFSPRSSPLAPRARDAAPAKPAGQQLAGIDTMYDVQRRYMRVMDESADGMGVEFEDDPTRPVMVGTLVTLHSDDEPLPVLCEVMRRSVTPDGVAHVGLRIVSRAPRKLVLARAGGRAVEAIYVPSDDASGQVDSFLVPEGDFDPREHFEVRFDDRSFVVRMNRVRYHGRGWHLAGFEVSEERAPGGEPVGVA